MHKQLMAVLIVLSCWSLAGTGCAKKELVRKDQELNAAAPAVSGHPQGDATTGAEASSVATAKAVEAAAVQAGAVADADKDDAVAGSFEAAGKIPSDFERVHFDFDSYLLTPEAREILVKNAEALTEGPQVKVRIAGHCDERGSDDYNLALSDRRARAALEYLVSLGVPRERLSVIGYGKERPLAPGHDEEAWAQNRRDEFEVVKP